MSDLLTTLNVEQKKAVLKTEGPLLILAGAGTGKTMTITTRIAYILAEKNILPEQILAVTFTNKAAREMEERIAKRAHCNTDKLWVSTFHAFCMRILRTYCRKLGYSPGFTLLDTSEQKGLVKQVMNQNLLMEEEKQIDVNDIQGQISRWKMANLSPSDIDPSELKPIDRKIFLVYRGYQDTIHAMNSMDFDDLLQQSVILLDEHEDVRIQLRAKFRYVLVDEFQDTNKIQLDLLKLICGTDNPNLCVVGDDDQSIYSWRGAEIENILRLDRHFSGVECIRLEDNYRSTGHILNAANAVISHNSERFPKVLRSQSGLGEPLQVVGCESAEKEAECIAATIQDKMAHASFTAGDQVILYRSNHQSRLLEISLRRRNIPYEIIGDNSFFERKEIKDALAYFVAAVNWKHDYNWLKVLNLPSRGFGPQSIKATRMEADRRGDTIAAVLQDRSFLESFGAAGTRVGDFAAKMRYWGGKLLKTNGLDLAHMAEDFLQDVGYLDGLLKIYKQRNEAEGRRENVFELLHSMVDIAGIKGESFEILKYLESVTLSEMQERSKEKEAGRNTVKLMTVHASKGLEFPVVYLCGMETGLFPHERSSGLRQIAEERRLFYVALTRAKKELILTWAKQRIVARQRQARRKSKFIAELPVETYQVSQAKDLLREVSQDDMDKWKAEMLKKFC